MSAYEAEDPSSNLGGETKCVVPEALAGLRGIGDEG